MPKPAAVHHPTHQVHVQEHLVHLAQDADVLGARLAGRPAGGCAGAAAAVCLIAARYAASDNAQAAGAAAGQPRLCCRGCEAKPPPQTSGLMWLCRWSCCELRLSCFSSGACCLQSLRAMRPLPGRTS